METSTTHCRHVLIEALPDLVVAEGETADLARPNQPCPDGLLQALLDALSVNVCHRRQQLQLERPAHDRRASEQVDDVRREVRESLSDGGHNPGRQHNLTRGCVRRATQRLGALAAPGALTSNERAALLPDEQQLLKEERVPFAMFEETLDGRRSN